jgi:hypothetical protein
MICAECATLQDAYREATRAYGQAFAHLTAVKHTSDFQAALDNSTGTKEAMDAARIAFRKHQADQHGLR